MMSKGNLGADELRIPLLQWMNYDVRGEASELTDVGESEHSRIPSILLPPPLLSQPPVFLAVLTTCALHLPHLLHTSLDQSGKKKLVRGKIEHVTCLRRTSAGVRHLRTFSG